MIDYRRDLFTVDYSDNVTINFQAKGCVMPKAIETASQTRWEIYNEPEDGPAFAGYWMEVPARWAAVASGLGFLVRLIDDA